MEIIKEIWVELGAIGVLISGLIWLCMKLSHHINKLLIDHKEERNEWRQEATSHTKKMMDVIEQNSSVISELCILIKSQNKK